MNTSRSASRCEQAADPDGPCLDQQEQRRDANALMGAGLGLGAFGAISAVALGATCPLCVVAAPLLLSVGVLKRLRCASGDRKT